MMQEIARHVISAIEAFNREVVTINGVHHFTQAEIEAREALVVELLTAEVLMWFPALPLPMVLTCPRCRTQHVDKPEPEINWANPPHRSHKCGTCGLVWRPADVETVGVESVKTVGKNDSAVKDWSGKWQGTETDGRCPLRSSGQVRCMWSRDHFPAQCSFEPTGATS